jgi:peptidoglycan lytic transglycosylase
LRRGDVMGRHSAALTGGRVARIGALILGSLALAHCSVADKFGKESKHSPKVIEDGESVPKGGGAYRVGKPYSINGRTYVPAEDPNYRAEGTASWYGPDFHGRLTANGEVYDMHGISAAHPTLPMPSYARVTNLENGRSIVVRINDRGPYARNRIIDLSIGTAKALKFHGQGLAYVRVEYLGRAPLEGSDDRMLMATLREGVPAPAPSRVMVASANPFVPNFGDASRDSASPVPVERPSGPGAGATRASPSGEITSSNKPPARSVVRMPAAVAAEPAASPPAASGLAAGFAPVRNDGAVGLMSGRGLY